MTTRFTLNLQALVTAAALASSAIGANGLECFGQPASKYAVADHVCDVDDSAPSSVDSDRDGVCDHDDAFPEDPCDSVDVGDGTHPVGANLRRLQNALQTYSGKSQAPAMSPAPQYGLCSGIVQKRQGYTNEADDFWLEWYFEFEGPDYLGKETGPQGYFGDCYCDCVPRTAGTCKARSGTGYAYECGEPDHWKRPAEDVSDPALLPRPWDNHALTSNINCHEGICWNGKCMKDAHLGDDQTSGRSSVREVRERVALTATFRSQCYQDLYAEMLAKHGNEWGDCGIQELGWATWSSTKPTDCTTSWYNGNGANVTGWQAGGNPSLDKYMCPSVGTTSQYWDRSGDAPVRVSEWAPHTAQSSPVTAQYAEWSENRFNATWVAAMPKTWCSGRGAEGEPYFDTQAEGKWEYLAKSAVCEGMCLCEGSPLETKDWDDVRANYKPGNTGDCAV